MCRLVTFGVSLLAFAVALPAGTPAAPVPKHLLPPKDVPYYPTEVGAKWVWDRSHVTPSGVTLVVTSVETTKEGTLVTSDGEKVLIAPHGLFLLERGGWKYDPPVCFLKLPHKPGETWETVTMFGEYEFTYTHKALEPVEVTVPAGRFQTLPVVEKRLMKNTPDNLWPDTSWYAPGVGCVKSTTPGGAKSILQSFKPCKE